MSTLIETRQRLVRQLEELDISQSKYDYLPFVDEETYNTFANRLDTNGIRNWDLGFLYNESTGYTNRNDLSTLLNTLNHFFLTAISTQPMQLPITNGNEVQPDDIVRNSYINISTHQSSLQSIRNTFTRLMERYVHYDMSALPTTTQYNTMAALPEDVKAAIKNGMCVELYNRVFRHARRESQTGYNNVHPRNYGVRLRISVTSNSSFNRITRSWKKMFPTNLLGDPIERAAATFINGLTDSEGMIIKLNEQEYFMLLYVKHLDRETLLYRPNEFSAPVKNNIKYIQKNIFKLYKVLYEHTLGPVDPMYEWLYNVDQDWPEIQAKMIEYMAKLPDPSVRARARMIENLGQLDTFLNDTPRIENELNDTRNQLQNYTDECIRLVAKIKEYEAHLFYTQHGEESTADKVAEFIKYLSGRRGQELYVAYDDATRRLYISVFTKMNQFDRQTARTLASSSRFGLRGEEAKIFKALFVDESHYIKLQMHYRLPTDRSNTEIATFSSNEPVCITGESVRSNWNRTAFKHLVVPKGAPLNHHISRHNCWSAARRLTKESLANHDLIMVCENLINATANMNLSDNTVFSRFWNYIMNHKDEVIAYDYATNTPITLREVANETMEN